VGKFDAFAKDFTNGNIYITISKVRNVPRTVIRSGVNTDERSVSCKSDPRDQPLSMVCQVMKGSDDTRQKIIEATIAAIESHGEAAIRVDAVVKAAGFTKPVLYHHFADREGLIAAAQAERFRRTLEPGIEAATALIDAAASSEDFLAAMRNLLKVFASPEGKERRRFRIEVLGAATSRPALMMSIVTASREYIDMFEMPLRIAEARGWLKPGVPVRDFAQWWVGLVLSRHLFEIDSEGLNESSWDALTDRVMCLIIADS
jgi:AcrR family transcriptional regulator